MIKQSIHQINTDFLNQIFLDYLQSPAGNLGLQTQILSNNTHNNTLEIILTAGFPIQALQAILEPKILNYLSNTYPNQNFKLIFNQNIRAHQTQLLNQSLRNIKNTIAIASGKGGVGKSTVSVNLAIALAKAGANVGLLDADIYGPSIPTMLGAVNPVEIVNDRYLPIRTHGIQAMSIGYLTQADPALLWRGPMLAKSLIQMLDITQWDNLDYLIIDLPPGTGDIPLSLVQKIPLTGAVVVSTPQTVAVKDAEKALKLFATTGIPVLGRIENMAYYHCPSCQHKDTLFDHPSAIKLDCAMLGQLPLNSQIVADCDNGLPTALANNPLSDAFMTIALKTAIAIQNRPIHYASKFPPIVTE